ncbi:Crp/Fnr family transcriptional regulator [Sphingomonas sp. MMS24-J13]|uniref:Crp/Fnr family transcriptional regulator n=1 Tax=Sphingomonas sp. MMS24-J13 TaxID=3238686 RepID=UPI00384A671B
MIRTVEQALALYLDRLLVRSVLSDEEKQAILRLPASASIVDVQHDFVRIGDKIKHACLIVDGLVARFAQIRNGTRGFVAFHIPGDMADLHSVVMPNVTWALHAVVPTTILRVPHAALTDLTVRFPAIALAFWRDCVVDGNVMAQWNVNIARKDAAARVAHLLCEMSLRYRAIGLGEDGCFPFAITQINLADAVGLTPIHLNRVLKRLREDGIVTKEADSVRICDFDRLATIGEFDAAYLQLRKADA